MAETVEFKNPESQVIAYLAAGKGIYVDDQKRLFVPRTGFPHVCRIDIGRLDEEFLQLIAHEYAGYIADEAHLGSFWGNRAFSVMVTDTPRAQRLANAVQKKLREGIKMHSGKTARWTKNVAVVPKDSTHLAGKRVAVVVDAIRTGYTLGNTLRELERAGAKTEHVFSLFNYQYGGDITIDSVIEGLHHKPTKHFMIERTDRVLFEREHVVGGDLERNVQNAIWEYQKGPVRYAINHLYNGFAQSRKDPREIVVPAERRPGIDDATAAREAIERAALRLSVEAELYPAEQFVWTPVQKAEVQNDLRKKMEYVRRALIERYGRDGLHWLGALEDLLPQAVSDAQVRGYSLNGRDPQHARNVRKFMDVLYEHHPKMPYNICGRLDLPTSK